MKRETTALYQGSTDSAFPMGKYYHASNQCKELDAPRSDRKTGKDYVAEEHVRRVMWLNAPDTMNGQPIRGAQHWLMRCQTCWTDAGYVGPAKAA